MERIPAVVDFTGRESIRASFPNVAVAEIFLDANCVSVSTKWETCLSKNYPDQILRLIFQSPNPFPLWASKILFGSWIKAIMPSVAQEEAPITFEVSWTLEKDMPIRAANRAGPRERAMLQAQVTSRPFFINLLVRENARTNVIKTFWASSIGT